MKLAIRRILNDSLTRNSFYILLSSMLSAGVGFVFWIVAARYYPKEEVGIATALVSTMALIVMLSRLGLDSSMIRFFPCSDKGRVFFTSQMVISMTLIGICAVFISGAALWSPELSFLKSWDGFIFTLFALSCSTVALSGNAFVAVRRSGLNLMQNIVLSSRILFLPFLCAFGAMGIFASVGLSYGVVVIIAVALLARSSIRLKAQLDTAYLRGALSYSAGNYISGLLMAAPGLVVPVMVLNVLGAEDAAVFYIAFLVASFLSMFPGAVATSMFVEGSHGESLGRIAVRSLTLTYSILVPATVVLLISSRVLLDIFGSGYAEGLGLLRLMCLSALFIPVISVYFARNKILKRMKELIVLSVFSFLLFMCLSYTLMTEMQLVGIGYAWLICYVSIAGLVSVLALRGGRTDYHAAQ